MTFECERYIPSYVVGRAVSSMSIQPPAEERAMTTNNASCSATQKPVPSVTEILPPTEEQSGYVIEYVQTAVDIRVELLVFRLTK